jgi:hypothetical protein
MKQQDDKLNELGRALAFGLPRREVARRLVMWLGAALLSDVLFRTSTVGSVQAAGQTQTPALPALEQSTPTAQIHEFCAAMYCVTAVALVNGTALPPSGVEFTAPAAVVNGTVIQGVATLGTALGSYCGTSYCYSLYPNADTLSLNATPISLNGTPLVYCAPEYCITAVNLEGTPKPPTGIPFVAPGVVVNGTPLSAAGPPNTPNALSLGEALGSNCGAKDCYSLYPNPANLVTVNGTPVSGSVTPILVNGTPTSGSGTTGSVNGTLIPFNGTPVSGSVTPIPVVNGTPVP